MRIGDVYRLSVSPLKAAEDRFADPKGLELSLAIVAYKLVALVADAIDALVRVLTWRRRPARRTDSTELEA